MTLFVYRINFLHKNLNNFFEFRRRVAFVIRIGTPQQIPSCRIQPISTYGSEILDRAVLLQYSYNGVDWLLLASHGIRNFIQVVNIFFFQVGTRGKGPGRSRDPGRDFLFY